MRNSILIRAAFFLVLSIAFGGLQAQSGVKDQVVSALGSGNASALAKYMVANVDMTLPVASDYYSNAQAEQILRKFFDEHPPKGLTIEHSGKWSFFHKTGKPMCAKNTTRPVRAHGSCHTSGSWHSK